MISNYLYLEVTTLKDDTNASGKVKKIPRSFRIPQQLSEAFDSYCEQSDKTSTDAFVHFLEQGLGNNSNSYQWLDSACPSLIHGEDGFFCAFKVPKAKPWLILSGSSTDAAKVCAACKDKTKLESIKEMLEQGGTASYHSCSAAGVLHAHDIDQIICPYKSNMDYVSIKQHCQRRNNGQPCEYLQVHTMQIESIKPRNL